MGSLVQDLSTLPQATAPIVLVVDDFHWVTERAIPEAITFLLEHQPHNFHLVLVSREDPLLPLARLRARRQVTEVRLADLRFTTAETAVFLNEIKGLALADSDIQALETRTEGWITGLQLAALSMARLDDATRFVQSFTGSSRYVLDYLIEEVLQQQDADMQEFLLQTAVLDRLNTPLCNALTGRQDSHTLLQNLLQANLFLIALDENGEWYRYHHLFAELLRHQLRISRFDTAVLHRRAGRWFREQELFAEAVPHLLAAKAWEELSAVLLPISERMLRRGEALTLLRWLEEIPVAIRQQQPALAMQHVWALILTGALDTAEAYLAPWAELAPAVPQLLGEVLTAQAYIARARADLAQTIRLSQQALAYLPVERSSQRSVLAVNLGIAHWMAGQVGAAEQVLTEARFTAQQARNHYAHGMAVGFLALVQGAQGKLNEAADLLQQYLHGQGFDPTLALAHRVLGAVLAEWGELETAVTHLQQAHTLAQAMGNAELLSGNLRGLALVKQQQGDDAGALETLAQIHEMDARHHLSPFTTACSAAAHAHIALAQGDLPTAAHWAAQISEPADGSPFYPRLHLTPARLLLAQGAKEKAAHMLAQLAAQAEQAGWRWGLIETRTLQALAAVQEETAVSFLQEALRLAEPQGFRRLFLDKGPPLAALLRQIRQRGVFPDYASQLLAAFQELEAAELESPSQPLIEPLSARELEFLQLLARQQTNAEIAQTLVVSLNTVKTHLQHIYGKLGVHSRKTAVSRARELGLLEK